MFSTFMINTWIAATIVAAVSGVIGFFVVIRGSSFAAHALPLGTFPGAALATLLGIDQLFGLVAFALLGIVGISQLGRHGRHEVATALSLVMLLGLGGLFLSMSSEYSQEVYALLFGEVLGVSSADLLSVALLSAVAVALTIVCFRPLMISSVSPELGEARGVSHRRMELAFLAILALATAMALPIVGALLVFSLMVGPAAFARALTTRPFRAMIISAMIAMVVAWLSIMLSYECNWPIGFFVGVLGAVCYGLGQGWSRLLGRVLVARGGHVPREDAQGLGEARSTAPSLPSTL